MKIKSSSPYRRPPNSSDIPSTPSRQQKSSKALDLSSNQPDWDPSHKPASTTAQAVDSQPSSDATSTSSVLSPKKELALIQADAVFQALHKDDLEKVTKLRSDSFETWTAFDDLKAAVSDTTRNKTTEVQQSEHLGLIPALTLHYEAKAAEFQFLHQLVKRLLKRADIDHEARETLSSICDELHIKKYVPLGHLKLLRERGSILEETAHSFTPEDLTYWLGSSLARFGQIFSRESNDIMKAQAIHWLGFGSRKAGSITSKDKKVKVQNYTQSWCPIHWRYKDKIQIKNAHIVPAALSTEQLRRMIGRKHSVMSKDNSLPMTGTMEKLWDLNAFIIVPKGKVSQTPERYKMLVTQNEIPEVDRIAGDMPSNLQWPGSYNGREVKFPTDKRPSKTYFFLRYCCQLFYLADKGGFDWLFNDKDLWQWTALEGIVSRPFMKWLSEQIQVPDFASKFGKGLRDVDDPLPMEDHEVAEFAEATFPRADKARITGSAAIEGNALILGAQADRLGISPTKSKFSKSSKSSRSSLKTDSDEGLCDEQTQDDEAVFDEPMQDDDEANWSDDDDDEAVAVHGKKSLMEAFQAKALKNQRKSKQKSFQNSLSPANRVRKSLVPKRR
jgi:hypothetical protein